MTLERQPRLEPQPCRARLFRLACVCTSPGGLVDMQILILHSSLPAGIPDWCPPGLSSLCVEGYRKLIFWEFSPSLWDSSLLMPFCFTDSLSCVIKDHILLLLPFPSGFILDFNTEADGGPLDPSSLVPSWERRIDRLYQLCLPSSRIAQFQSQLCEREKRKQEKGSFELKLEDRPEFLGILGPEFNLRAWGLLCLNVCHLLVSFHGALDWNSVKILSET